MNGCICATLISINMQSIINIKIRFIVCFTMIMFFTIYKVSAQVNYDQLSDRFIAGKENDIYGINSKFIENVGQYGTIYEQYPEMGTILFAYEGFDIPILFTEKGIIHLHRKVKGPTPEEKEKEEKKEKPDRAARAYEKVLEIDPAAGSESGNIGNLNPKSALTKKGGA